MDEKSRQRIPILDEVRGLSLVVMVLYHVAYDLIYLFGQDVPLFFVPFIAFLGPVFAGNFLFLAGLSTAFSHNNLRRGLLCLAAATLITATTFFFLPNETIVFGVLHCIGFCILLYTISSPLLRKIPVWPGFFLCLCLFFLAFHLPSGYVGLFQFRLFSIPAAPYEANSLFLSILGFPGTHFISSDYFPLLPWLFLFLAGSFVGPLVKERKAPAFFYRPHLPFLAFCGRHSLLIYLLHQPILYGVLSFLFLLF